MDEKLIKLPQNKKNICGLLVAREELYKDLFVKKKLYQKKKEYLRAKGFELGFLRGLISQRKELKIDPVDKAKLEPKREEIKQEPEQEIEFKNGKPVNMSAQEKDSIIIDDVPLVLNIPFWLIPIKDDQNVIK